MDASDKHNGQRDVRPSVRPSVRSFVSWMEYDTYGLVLVCALDPNCGFRSGCRGSTLTLTPSSPNNMWRWGGNGTSNNRGRKSGSLSSFKSQVAQRQFCGGDECRTSTITTNWTRRQMTIRIRVTRHRWRRGVTTVAAGALTQTLDALDVVMAAVVTTQTTTDEQDFSGVSRRCACTGCIGTEKFIFWRFREILDNYIFVVVVVVLSHLCLTYNEPEWRDYIVTETQDNFFQCPISKGGKIQSSNSEHQFSLMVLLLLLWLLLLIWLVWLFISSVYGEENFSLSVFLKSYTVIRLRKTVTNVANFQHLLISTTNLACRSANQADTVETRTTKHVSWCYTKSWNFRRNVFSIETFCNFFRRNWWNCPIDRCASLSMERSVGWWRRSATTADNSTSVTSTPFSRRAERSRPPVMSSTNSSNGQSSRDGHRQIQHHHHRRHLFCS